jgi:hypothetical protein
MARLNPLTESPNGLNDQTDAETAESNDGQRDPYLRHQELDYGKAGISCSFGCVLYSE